MKFIAYTTKGLEFIVEKEIKSHISNAKIIELDDKRIIFESNADYTKLIELKTVDDLGLHVLTFKQNSLEDCITEINSINFEEIFKIISGYRKIIQNFSITTSLVGVKKFKSPELIQAISQHFSQKYNWNFTQFNHTNFDIRVFIDHNKGYISIRLTKESLHQRTYKTAFKEGSLRITVAASMVYLSTEGKTNLKIVDNFCGSGTVLAEGLLAGNDVYGGDIDPKNIINTQENLANLKYKYFGKIKHLNALTSEWQSNYFDVAISNLPWGKQVEIKNIIQLYEGSICEYARILKPNGILCTLVSNPELFVKFAKKYFPNKDISQYKIGLLGQNPTIVLVKN